MKRLAPQIVIGAFFVVLLLFLPAAAQQPLPTALSLPKAIETVLKENAQISAARSRVEAAQERIVQARSGLFPQVEFSESYNRTTNPMWAFGTKLNQGVIQTPDFNPDRLNNPDAADNFASTFSVMSLNLFSGRRLAAKHREAKINHREVTAVQRDLEQQIRLQTQQAFLSAQSAWKRIRVARTAVAQAAEALRIVRNRYNSGLLNIVELLDAEVVLQQARVNTLKAIHDYRTAVVQLHLAAGIIDENFT